MNIRQKINAVQKKVDYVKKDAVIDNKYSAVTHDNVLAAVRPHMVEQGILIEPDLLEHTWYEPRKGKENSTNWLYEATFCVKFVNIEDPADLVSVVVSGHANDTGDKAAGKALSYAVKNATLKVFALETGVNDEGRNYDPSEYTDEQKAIFDDLLLANDARGFYCYSLTLPEAIRIGLARAAEKGEKTKRLKQCRALEKAGAEAMDEVVIEIQGRIDADDPSVIELTDEMEHYEKAVVIKRLREGDVKYLSKLAQGV